MLIAMSGVRARDLLMRGVVASQELSIKGDQRNVAVYMLAGATLPEVHDGRPEKRKIDKMVRCMIAIWRG